MPDNIEVQVESQPSISSLVGGIINDAQQLIRQEVALARKEIQEELGKAKSAAVSMAAGLALAVVGGLLLCQMLVYLLQDLTGLPLWGCFAIVGGTFLLLAVVLALVARNMVGRIDVVPRQTVETMKENVQWIKSQT